MANVILGVKKAVGGRKHKKRVFRTKHRFFFHFSAHVNMTTWIKHQEYITFGIYGQSYVLIFIPLIVFSV